MAEISLLLGIPGLPIPGQTVLAQLALEGRRFETKLGGRSSGAMDAASRGLEGLAKLANHGFIETLRLCGDGQPLGLGLRNLQPRQAEAVDVVMVAMEVRHGLNRLLHESAEHVMLVFKVPVLMLGEPTPVHAAYGKYGSLRQRVRPDSTVTEIQCPLHRFLALTRGASPRTARSCPSCSICSQPIPDPWLL